MARPIKQGLDYYPYDVDADLDDKLGMIIGEFGEKGERLWQRLLAYTYKHNGYFMEWSEDVQLKFLRRYSYCGFNMSFIQEVVPRFIKWGLFDQTVFNAFQILTSKRIQSTWLDATRKRKGGVIDERIWLLGVIAGVKAEETRFTAEEKTQKKVKESKVKESKEKTISENLPPPLKTENKAPQTGGAVANGPPFEEVHMFFRGAGGTEEMARKFWNKWEGLQWRYNSQPIVWRPFALNFLNNYEENERRHGKGDSKNGRSAHGQSAGAIKLAQSLADDLGISGAGGASNP